MADDILLKVSDFASGWNSPWRNANLAVGTARTVVFINKVESNIKYWCLFSG
jgi:hypothetical protein